MFLGGGLMSREGTPLERVVTAFNIGVPDRVPVFNVGGVSRKVIGVKLLDMMRNPDVQAKAQLAAYRRIGHDSVSIGVDVAVEPEALGCKIKFSEDAQPMVIEPLIKVPEDVDKLRIPDPEKDGRMPVNIKAARMLLDEVGDVVDVSAWVMGPFSLAALIRGSEFFKDLIRRPEMAHKMIKTLMQCQKVYSKGFLDEGVRTICMPDPSASPNLISPKFYNTFALPYEIELFTYLKKRGVRVFLHICGDTTLILEDMAKSGANCLSIDQPPDLAYAKEKVGHKVCLHGNVRTVNTLLTGKPAEVEREARECILKAAKGGGYMLGSSCDFPPMTPIENIKAMVRAAKKYGRYASDGSLLST